MSAVVHTGSSEARSACGTKVIVFADCAPTMRGAASAAAPASADLRKVRRFTKVSLRRSFRSSAAAAGRQSGARLGPVHPALLHRTLLRFWRHVGTPRAYRA